MITDKEFVDAVRNARLSRVQLAEVLIVSLPDIRRWRAGQNLPVTQAWRAGIVEALKPYAKT